MAQPAYTLAQYNSLIAAIAEGVRKVKYEDRETEYRSLSDMNRIRVQMEKALGLDDGKPKRKRMAHSKGLGGTPSSSSTNWEIG